MILTQRDVVLRGAFTLIDTMSKAIIGYLTIIQEEVRNNEALHEALITVDRVTETVLKLSSCVHCNAFDVPCASRWNQRWLRTSGWGVGNGRREPKRVWSTDRRHVGTTSHGGTAHSGGQNPIHCSPKQSR